MASDSVEVVAATEPVQEGQGQQQITIAHCGHEHIDLHLILAERPHTQCARSALSPSCSCRSSSGPCCPNSSFPPSSCVPEFSVWLQNERVTTTAWPLPLQESQCPVDARPQCCGPSILFPLLSGRHTACQRTEQPLRPGFTMEGHGLLLTPMMFRQIPFDPVQFLPNPNSGELR